MDVTISLSILKRILFSNEFTCLLELTQRISKSIVVTLKFKKFI